MLSEVANNTGCIATDSVIEIGGDILFLAADGIRPIQGTARIGDVELQTVSKPIQQILREVPNNFDLSLLNAVVIGQVAVQILLSDDYGQQRRRARHYWWAAICR